MTYAYVSKATVQRLLDFAEVSSSKSQLAPVNFTLQMEKDDMPPAGVRESDLALLGRLLIYDALPRFVMYFSREVVV